MLKGIKEDIFEKNEWKQSLSKLIEKELLVNIDGTVKLTDKGLDLANQVFVEFV